MTVRRPFAAGGSAAAEDGGVHPPSRRGVIAINADGFAGVSTTSALALLGLPPDWAGRPFHVVEALSSQVFPAVFAIKGTRACVLRLDDGTELSLQTEPLASGGVLLTVEELHHHDQPSELPGHVQSEYRSLFEHAVYGVYRDTLDGRPVRANPALVRFNGYETEDEYIAAVGRNGGDWYVDPANRDRFFRMLHGEGRVRDLVSEVYRHRTRERVWITENAWYVRDETGNPVYIEGTIIDATERMEALAATARQANTDALTGAASRFHFMRRLKEMTANPESVFVLFCIDLDHFKEVNDQYGHAAGDTVLKAVAARLQKAAGAGATVARLGGDEFAVIMPGTAASMNADMTAAEMVRALRTPMPLEGQIVSVGASIGVALYPAHAQNAEELLSHADLALYDVKSRGRNGACLFRESIKAMHLRRRAMETELGNAIAEGALELHYQPIVAAETGETASYEALMRWNHPRRGLLPPLEFIAIAEDAGLMNALGRWAIHRACKQAALLPPHLSVAVNVSPSQLRSSDIVEAVKQSLASTGLESSRLTLEITETAIISGEGRAAELVDELAELGVRLALDDFGTGYSSLSYLQRFAFSKVKIDRSFVADLAGKPRNLKIIRAVVRLAKDLGMDIVAEGVETSSQAELLGAEGCGFLQGYLYGRPQPFLEVLADANASALRRSGLLACSDPPEGRRRVMLFTTSCSGLAVDPN